MAFNSAFGSFSSATATIAGLTMLLFQLKPYFNRASFLLDSLPESSGNKEMPGNLTGSIEISNVSFAYATNEGNVLNGISLHIHAGEYVGIVGASGCGKSTLLKLLLGFESPDIGRIYFDGKDISNIDKRELRKKFGIVLQNGNLVTGSIQENISIVAPGITLERISLCPIQSRYDVQDGHVAFARIAEGAFHIHEKLNIAPGHVYIVCVLIIMGLCFVSYKKDYAELYEMQAQYYAE